MCPTEAHGGGSWEPKHWPSHGQEHKGDDGDTDPWPRRQVLLQEIAADTNGEAEPQQRHWHSDRVADIGPSVLEGAKCIQMSQESSLS
jgi:hypothetical protein